ncbi:hypothetical protein TNCV_3256361 [Trichonephila clavipes]|nr:hypothetical protein TNCV_3256361 [Trichonephila clavipes]
MRKESEPAVENYSEESYVGNYGICISRRVAVRIIINRKQLRALGRSPLSAPLVTLQSNKRANDTMPKGTKLTRKRFRATNRSNGPRNFQVKSSDMNNTSASNPFSKLLHHTNARILILDRFNTEGLQ